jgi:hypothetical protein
MNQVCGEQKGAGIIRPSSTHDFCTESTFPGNKDADGQWTTKRHCLDFRALNKVTNFLRYPLPRVEELLEKVGKAKVFSKVDFRSGFHQIPLREGDKHKTAFRWNNQMWEYERMPFGLKNACTHFMLVMDHEIRVHGLQDFTACYVDDIVIFSDTPEEHMKHLEQLFKLCQEVGLRIHPGKCVFGADAVEFLGHTVSTAGTTPSHAKVKAIMDLPTPGNVPALRSALGLFNYYRCYVPNYSAIAQPLHDLLQKNAPWRWNYCSR